MFYGVYVAGSIFVLKLIVFGQFLTSSCHFHYHVFNKALMFDDCRL